MSRDQEISATKGALQLHAKYGITNAHEGATHLSQFNVMQRATIAGGNMIDVIAFLCVTDVDKILKVRPLNQWLKYDNHLKIGGVKITIDGSLQERKIQLTTPYLQGKPAGENDWKGKPTFPQPMVNNMVKKVYNMGVPLNLHANGNGAIDAFFKAHQFAANNGFEKNVKLLSFMHSYHAPISSICL